MRFGMVGLGRMGGGLARRSILGGHECVGYDPDARMVAELVAVGGTGLASLAELVKALKPPRRIWVMVPDTVTGQVIDDLADLVSPGDTIVDGGNSNFRHSVDRGEMLAAKRIHFVDVGTSGGVFGLERGFCLMIGGEADVVTPLAPLFDSLVAGHAAAPRSRGRTGDISSAENGWLHCGPIGAGHFAKMIHNGIEYGMMAAMAEGMNLLAHANGRSADPADVAKLSGRPYYRFDYDLPELAELWRRGSVIASWLLDLTANALREDPTLEGFTGRVGDSGEGRWTVRAGIDLGVPTHTLSAALFDRFASRGNADLANRLLSAMRKQFGGHTEPGKKP
jgi:6-phosphogluconate dehydrogenase